MRVWSSILFFASVGCADAVGVVVDYGDTGSDTAVDTGTVTESDSGKDTDDGAEAMPYLLGADISWVQEQEDNGVLFTDDGAAEDLIAILGHHGFNAVRLRIFHSPGQPDGYQHAFAERAEPYCDLLHTIEMALRVKDAGMAFFLDFHYSDTWADPGAQVKPAAWADLGFDDLSQALYDYTRDTLSAFRAAGALPDMIQVGNEITSGMLHPDGKTYDPDNWDQLAQLLIAATEAVKDVDTRIKTVVHLDRGGDNEGTVWWVDEALSRGVRFDVLAESTYTAWQGEPDSWRANFDDLASRYPELSFLVAEYADNHLEVNDIMRDTPRGLGTFVWEPTADGDWGSGLFDMPDGANEATPRPTLNLFDQMADDFGLRD